MHRVSVAGQIRWFLDASALSPHVTEGKMWAIERMLNRLRACRTFGSSLQHRPSGISGFMNCPNDAEYAPLPVGLTQRPLLDTVVGYLVVQIGLIIARYPCHVAVPCYLSVVSRLFDPIGRAIDIRREIITATTSILFLDSTGMLVRGFWNREAQSGKSGNSDVPATAQLLRGGSIHRGGEVSGPAD
jgi:F0F1-type ATP synthase, alpha subunit